MAGPEGAGALFEAYLERHAACDLDGVLGLFADGAVLEDPVGSPVHVGHEALRAFFRETHARNGRLRVERRGPVVVCAREAAAHIRASAEAADFALTLDVYYTLVADPSERRIESLRAFFQFD